MPNYYYVCQNQPPKVQTVRHIMHTVARTVPVLETELSLPCVPFACVQYHCAMYPLPLPLPLPLAPTLTLHARPRTAPHAPSAHTPSCGEEQWCWSTTTAGSRPFAA
jgi:hypothetical protein